MISSIGLLNTITGMNSLVSGLTIVAVGNSFPDIFISMALANKGYLIMAVTGIFAGVLINMLVGFSLSCILKAVRFDLVNRLGNEPFDLFSWTAESKEQNIMIGIVLVSSFVLSIGMLIRIMTNG